MMKTSKIPCIRSYIQEKYSGNGLIGISDLAKYCGTIEGEIYVNLLALKHQGEIDIIIRYFCPETHQISNDEFPYCSECDYEYFEDYITTLVYVKPIKVNQEVK